jgi:hypothetical protein
MTDGTQFSREELYTIKRELELRMHTIREWDLQHEDYYKKVESIYRKILILMQRP